MKNLYLICGASGSGKSTVEKKLVDAGLKTVKSYTTRPPRSKFDDTHTFITDEEFNSLQNIVAFTEFDGYKYAATEEQLMNADIYVIDPDGIKKLKQSKIFAEKCKTIVLTCSESTRKKRMVTRGGNKIQVLRRVSADRSRFADSELKELADYIVDAERPISAVFDDILAIIKGKKG